MVPVFTLLGFVGCAAVPQVAPQPAGAPVTADMNGDGLADLSDAVFLREYLFNHGRKPVCDVAADPLTDGLVEMGDEMVILSYAIDGTSVLSPLYTGACDHAESAEVPAPTRVAFGLSGPSSAAQLEIFDVAVTVTSPEKAVQAWTLSVHASGCTVQSVTTDGTDVALVDKGGQRPRHSYAMAELSTSGAVSAVMLDWNAPTALAARADPWTLLTMRVELVDPSCTISLVGGEQGPTGPKLRNAVTLDGWTFVPDDVELKING